MGPETGLLSIITLASAGLGIWEATSHRRVLEAIPLRVHVNGTRGKTSVTKTIAALFRNLGKPTAAKCTGTVPLFIAPDGTERPWPRRGRARVQEQVRFLREARRAGAEVAVVECMAVDPVLQWIAEHRLVRSHIGVITNVRRDHLEDMGHNLEQIARSLANTIPRSGFLVTADARFAPLFEELARPLGTRVVLAVPGEDDDGMFPENRAIARAVARLAGFSDEEISRAAQHLPDTSIPATPLPAPAAGSVWVHAWSMNDPDSFEAFFRSPLMPRGTPAVVYNHRWDRPLRAIAFGRLLASWPDLARVLVTGDAEGANLLARAGVPRARLGRLAFPPRPEDVARAVADLPQPAAVVGCGNARGLAAYEGYPPGAGTP
ncbi:MAG: poly-gamma-glutamate synthase PgsB [Firmicutes bacterium]|nr:poly-gamma-glutamate synthase PgsB [Bacillota bacterium]